jgi:hypothetical protein
VHAGTPPGACPPEGSLRAAGRGRRESIGSGARAGLGGGMR